MIVAVATRRVEAGRLVEARFGPCVHVLDDGFQHLGLARDLDLVAIDAEDLAGRPMPAGRAARAAGRAGPRRPRAPRPRATAPRSRPGSTPRATLRWHRRSLGFFSPEGAAAADAARAFVLSAIAAPERLIADLSGLGCRVVGQALFRDHHRFTAAELAAAAAAAARGGRGRGGDDGEGRGAAGLAMARRTWPGRPLVVHRIEAVLEDEGRLREIVLRAARAA